MFSDDLRRRIVNGLAARQWKLATAESCTGGLVAATCTGVAGSSVWFEAGFVTYSAAAKARMLGIPSAVIDRYGAVSEPVARLMAEGAISGSGADIAVAVTGIAGPGGGEPLLPAGSVWFAWACRHEAMVRSALHRIPGDRAAVRRTAVVIALEGIALMLGGS